MTAAVSMARQREKFNRAVRVCMARQGIETVRALAGRVGMEEKAVYRRMKGESQWTLRELWKLVRVLEPTAEELANMMGRPG